MSESAPPLISECPSCQTRFQVTQEQLAVADGRVRCGACLALFDGRDALVPAAETQTGPHAGAEEAPVADDPVGVLLDTAQSTRGRGSMQTQASPASAEQAREPPAEADRPTRAAAFAAAMTAALAFLVAGIMTVQYDALVQHPVWRDAYEALGLEVPRYRALDAIRIANQSVGERSGEEVVLRLDLANTAPRHQRFPTLAVRFHRVGGEPLPEQRVESAAYLPSPTHSRRMTPNQATSVLLRLDDPGPEAVSYSISLL